MFKVSTITFALLVVAGTSAQAQTKVACVDSRGGTYSAKVDSQKILECANGTSCALKGQSINSLTFEGNDMNTDTASEISFSLRAILSGVLVEQPSPQPTFHSSNGILMMCSSPISQESFEQDQIDSRLGEFK